MPKRRRQTERGRRGEWKAVSNGTSEASPKEGSRRAGGAHLSQCLNMVASDFPPVVASKLVANRENVNLELRVYLELRVRH